MATPNGSDSSATFFILIGIPGLEAAQFWLAFPLCSLFLVAVLGNGILVYVVGTEPGLREPMYLFLGMLSTVDALLATAAMPRMLGLFWFNSTAIAFDTCLVQMFAIHSLSAIESSILLAMALDRYVAICHPLRHATLLTPSRVAKLGVAAVVRGVALMAPLPVFLRHLPFCDSKVLSHSFCLHQDVMKLACADITTSVVYGLVVIVSAIGLDALLVSLSYALILRAALRLSREARLKALATCVSHAGAVFLFYAPFIGLSVIHRSGHRVSSSLHVVLANVYLLVPPVLNPVVYGIGTTRIRQRILRVFHSVPRDSSA
ncbi:olfactory receptor 51E1-like [Tachyglossus aculeatus]|uniref:olfactory receptor 51E1-like n=1 Tax=Tachyglossus aculeatus TaxID=9261 RepID=UPI0018F361C0|nr:olfactory receptor 51E1-like [Tachyglossus aculeatus]